MEAAAEIGANWLVISRLMAHIKDMAAIWQGVTFKFPPLSFSPLLVFGGALNLSYLRRPGCCRAPRPWESRQGQKVMPKVRNMNLEGKGQLGIPLRSRSIGQVGVGWTRVLALGRESLSRGGS